jgi:predicted HTH transcriptional regulator
LGNYIRNKWNEEEVQNLPAGEHDYFDRKGAGFLTHSDFRAEFGKALSAFANSGGGHLIIGVEDDGTISGVPAVRGRTSTREWLEQLLPELVAPPLSGFRVHEVINSAATATPSGRSIIVVDVPDSHFAPHQSRVSCIYYYRVGGHSRHAPHFYIEALRNRTVGPSLVPNLKRSEVFAATRPACASFSS